MNEKKGSGQGFLSLFNGNIQGSVINPYTGTVMSRREVLELYRFLVVKHLDDPKDDWAIEMLLHTRDLLGIPMDLHYDLIEEFKRIDRSRIPKTYKRPILEEIETVRLFREGFVHGGVERTSKGSEENEKVVKEMIEYLGSDLLEMEKASLLKEMEKDEVELGDDTALSNDYMIDSEKGIMENMLSTTRKRPKKP